jgi:hypothetical protein
MNAGPVDTFKLKIILNVMNANPNEPTPNQRFRESPEIIRKRRYCWNRRLVSALIMLL